MLTLAKKNIAITTTATTVMFATKYETKKQVPLLGEAFYQQLIREIPSQDICRTTAVQSFAIFLCDKAVEEFRRLHILNREQETIKIIYPTFWKLRFSYAFDNCTNEWSATMVDISNLKLGEVTHFEITLETLLKDPQLHKAIHDQIRPPFSFTLEISTPEPTNTENMNSHYPKVSPHSVMIFSVQLLYK